MAWQHATRAAPERPERLAWWGAVRMTWWSVWRKRIKLEKLELSWTQTRGQVVFRCSWIVQQVQCSNGSDVSHDWGKKRAKSPKWSGGVIQASQAIVFTSGLYVSLTLDQWHTASQATSITLITSKIIKLLSYSINSLLKWTYYFTAHITVCIPHNKCNNIYLSFSKTPRQHIEQTYSECSEVNAW